ENADRIIQLAGCQEFLGHVQVLRTGIIEESLLSVEFGQLQHALKGRLELADFLVHGDGLDRETLIGIGIAHGLEALGGFVDFAETGIEIADGIGDREVLGIGFEDLFVLGDGVLHLALLDILLRSAENVLFVEPETERHMSTNSRTWFTPAKAAPKDFHTLKLMTARGVLPETPHGQTPF